MREIKFRAWDGERMLFMGKGGYCDFELSGGHIFTLSEFESHKQDYPLMQYTGLKDKNGVEIYQDDLINVFYTSNNGENYHDCIYKVTYGDLGIKLVFQKLMWVSEGYNQYPMSNTLSEEFKNLDYGYFDENNTQVLMVKDCYAKNHLTRHEWKSEDRSMYFEVIGNIHQHPELLNDNK